MVAASILGYIAGAASGLVKDIAKSATNAVKKTVTGPINKAISSVSKKPPGPVLKSTEGMNLKTGEPLQPTSSLEREGPKIYKIGPESYDKEPDYAATKYAAALLAPLIIGAAWLAYISLIGRSNIPAEQLSPFYMNRQILLLSLFIIIYSIFLILFSIGKEKTRKNAKKVKGHTKKKK